jgi:hypothetical protein
MLETMKRTLRRTSLRRGSSRRSGVGKAGNQAKEA